MAAFNLFDHVVENRSARRLGRHGFDEFAHDEDAFLAGQLAEFVELAFDGQHLPVVLVGRFPGIQKKVQLAPPFFVLAVKAFASATTAAKALMSGGASGFNSKCVPSLTMNILEPALSFSRSHSLRGMVNCPLEVMLAISIVMPQVLLAAWVKSIVFGGGGRNWAAPARV